MLRGNSLPMRWLPLLKRRNCLGSHHRVPALAWEEVTSSRGGLQGSAIPVIPDDCRFKMMTEDF